MNIKTIKNTIEKNDKYNFLKTDERLKDKIILLTLGGSMAYGTDVNNEKHQSDLDLRGIFANSRKEILTVNCNEEIYTINNNEYDVSLYPVVRMFYLLARCNPNTLEIINTEEEHLFICNQYGKLIRDNADAFLSKRAIYTFGMYAEKQLRRLENALARGKYPQSEKEKHILKILKANMFHFKETYQEFDNNSINLYVKDSLKKSLDKEIYMDIKLSNYPLRDFSSIYSEMKAIIKDFDKLNHRNVKKNEIHLYKHSMHLLRLLLMGIEIVKGEGVHTYRKKDRKLLLNIRNEVYSFEEIFELTNKYAKEFEYASKNTVLPDNPDEKRINDIIMEINSYYINIE